ncbi:ABC transporter permease [Spiroplasma endosymbiont of Cantharis nigra]|uniref:ABC transporter permease n=1 Tax=Spiroplasma endosymbiont of Cantharis nigra TaxID=3066278 RepID=UPI0030D27822
MKKTLFLYLKQGIKGVMKFKIQFVVIVILSFLATFILSVSFSTTKRISEDYRKTMSKMDPFDFVNQQVVGVNGAQEKGSNIIAPMDILNNQFLYVKDSKDLTSQRSNRAIDLNYNISHFSNFSNEGYDETFLNRTFKDQVIQEKFLEMLSDKDYWSSIFQYTYDPIRDEIKWEPSLSINFNSSASSHSYLTKAVSNKNNTISNFYLPTIELLKKNYLQDLFSENTPSYIKSTLFYELKNKEIITYKNFEANLQDNSDFDIYNRYLYFSLETFIRQLINSTTEYPIYWINKAIENSSSKERESLIMEFNKLNENNEIGFNFLLEKAEEENKTQNRKFAVSIFRWIFGFNPNLPSDWNEEEIGPNDKFIVDEDSKKPWKNNIDLSSENIDLDRYAKSKEEIFKNGMRGSLNQIVLKRSDSGKIYNYDSSFSSKYLRHYDSNSIEQLIGYNRDFEEFDNYNKEYNYEGISAPKAFYLKNEILAKAMDFKYEARAEMEFTDVISEVNYRIIDINNHWKDKLTLYEGNLPRTKNEILINPQFATANKYRLGDNIVLGESNFVISGFAVDPLSYFPMANTQNPLPNNKKNAIIFATKDNFNKIISTQLEKLATKSIYSMLTVENKNNKSEIDKNLEKYRAYSFNNIIEIYDSYNFIIGSNDKLKNDSLINSYSTFDSSNLNLNWVIAPMLILSFKIFSYVFSILVFIITIVATVVAVKKTVELNSGEIAILKAMGAGNFEISSSYVSYGIIVTIFVVPIAWLLGSFIQEFVAKVFLQFSSGKSNLIIFSPLALTISILIFGLILCLISFFTAFFLVKKPTLEIMHKMEKVKRIKWVDKINNKMFKNRSFSTRFSIELATSGFSKTILSATTIFFAGFLVSFGLTIPGLVQNVVGSYYKNVYYSNYFENRELIGNAPLAKTSLSPTREVDYYEKALFESNNIFGNGITKISKTVSDFSPPPDSSAIPQILLSQEENNQLKVNWIYNFINGVSSKQDDLREQNSLIAIIASLLGNNINQLVGKGISISDIQKILEWTIHSNSQDFVKFEDRLQKIRDLSGLLTDGLPQLLLNFIDGSSMTDGDWKEQIVNIIIAQTPSYIKQYVTRSENRLNNFAFGWQINKYIPGVDNVYTRLNVGTKNNIILDITGLQSTQNAYKMTMSDRENLFISDYQAQILQQLIKGETIEPSKLKEISKFYDGNNLTIPVIANEQTDFELNKNWENLDSPKIEKNRLVLRENSLNIPNEAWMYDDGDWLKYKNLSSSGNIKSFIEMESLSASKFTYAPIFDQTGFDLFKSKEMKLKDNAYGFFNLSSTPSLEGEKLEFEIRPYYSFDNITMFIPSIYKENFMKLKQSGNRDSSQWWKDDASKFVPEETKRAWEKINPNLTNNSEYFAFKPYSLYYDASGNFEREHDNLSGTPVEYMTKGYENLFARTLRENDGPITLGNVEMNWISNNKNIQKIKFKKIGSIGVYGKPIVIADQSIVNMLSGYGISKYIPFNLKYEDYSKPAGSYSVDGVNINTYDYMNPIDFNKKAENNINDLIYGNNDFEKSIRPSMWYSGILSNAEEPYFITSQASFSRDYKAGQDTMNGNNYGSTTLEMNSTVLLGQQKALIKQLSSIVLSVATVAICLLIIIIILTITLINDLYVNQYKKFMIVMKSLGYSNWKIIKYTFGSVTILSALFYALGVFTNFTIITILFNVISKQLGSIPFGLTWWSPILAIILVFGSFFISITITTKNIRKKSPSVLMN